MVIAHFEAYFHLFAAGNLGFAGSKRFQEAVDNRIFSMAHDEKEAVLNRCQELKARAIVLNQERREPFHKSTSLLAMNSTKRYDQLDEFYKKKYGYLEGYKSMFVMTAAFCLIFLIFCGYEECFISGTLNSSLFFLCAVTLAFNIVVFIRGFFNSATIPIRARVPLILQGGVLTVLCIWHLTLGRTFEMFPKEGNVGFALFVATTPFLFHFIRAIRHNNEFKKDLLILKNEIDKKIYALDTYIETDEEFKKEAVQ